MINIHGLEHVWVCSPDILYNEKKVLRVHVKLAKAPELAANGEGMSNLDEKAKEQFANDYVNKKIVKIEGLSIGDGDNKKEITTFNDLVESGVYVELVNWCVGAIYSERLLSKAELGN